jgi:hypothetical protein
VGVWEGGDEGAAVNRLGGGRACAPRGGGRGCAPRRALPGAARVWIPEAPFTPHLGARLVLDPLQEGALHGVAVARAGGVAARAARAARAVATAPGLAGRRRREYRR